MYITTLLKENDVRQEYTATFFSYLNRVTHFNDTPLFMLYTRTPI